MRTLPVLVIAAIFAHVLSGAASAQSLGEVARREEARRKAVKSPGKVYTDGSLRGEPAPSVPPAPAVAAPAAPEKTATPEKPPASPEPKKDETYWKQRMTAERDALSRAQIFAESLQSRINALTNDFSSRDDPFQRNQIAADRQKSLAELERVRKEIETHTKAIGDIQEEARKAGVPAGWVR